MAKKHSPPGSNPPRAPSHLRAKTRDWFRSVVDAFELEGHHLHLLTLAAEALDRSAEAREAIVKDGAFITDRFGILKAHPAVTVERDAKGTFARLLRELGLDVAKEAPRPPTVSGRRKGN